MFGEDHILWEYIGLAIAGVPILHYFYKKDMEFAGKRTLGVGTCTCLICLGVVFSIGFRLLFEKIGVPGYEEAAALIFIGNRVLEGLVLLVVTPLLEEYFFRGFLYRKLRTRISVPAAGLYSSILFGVYHGNLSQGIYGFFMGLFLAWTMEHYKTIKAPILVHMAANGAALIFQWFL